MPDSGAPAERLPSAERGFNPHNWLTSLDPPYTSNRRWRCNYCGAEGLYESLNDGTIPCMHVYPPCEHCGKTPECARDCKGIAIALGSPDVYLGGLGKPVGDV